MSCIRIVYKNSDTEAYKNAVSSQSPSKSLNGMFRRLLETHSRASSLATTVFLRFGGCWLHRSAYSRPSRRVGDCTKAGTCYSDNFRKPTVPAFYRFICS